MKIDQFDLPNPVYLSHENKQWTVMFLIEHITIVDDKEEFTYRQVVGCSKMKADTFYELQEDVYDKYKAGLDYDIKDGCLIPKLVMTTSIWKF